MTRLIDLTRTLDSQDFERLPERAKKSSSVLVPRVEYYAPAERGADVMCEIFACSREHLPAGEGWGEERVSINSHIGTHVDAPLHYGSQCEGKPARTVEAIRLEELYCDALVLDVRAYVQPNAGIPVHALREALAANGGEITAGSAVLLRTGQERYDLADARCYEYPGMTRAGTLWLAEQGAKVPESRTANSDHAFRAAFPPARPRKAST